MIGPVQLLVIGFKGPRAPDEVREQVDALLADHDHVRVIDVLALVMHRDRTQERLSAQDLLHALLPKDSGETVSRLLSSAGASSVVVDSTSGGQGYLFSGGHIPTAREFMKPGTGAVVLLLEHLWAIPLRDAVVESDAFPAADAWVGRTALQELDLIPSAESKGAGMRRAAR